MDADQRINRLARRQHGLITRRQALAAGAHRRSIDRKLGSGLWVPVRRGVFAIDGSPRTWEQTVLAACLAAAAPVSASHATAARLWGLSRMPATDSIHLLGDLASSVRREGVVLHRTARLEAVDVATYRRIPVTSVARTIVDCSGWLGSTTTGEVLDDAMRRRLVTLERVRACSARTAAPGRGPLGPIRTVLADRLAGYDPGESDLELRALQALRLAGHPAPIQQHRVHIAPKRFRLDLAYPDHMLGIELDGWDPHGVRSAFDDDRARDALLATAGWQVVHFTSNTIGDIADRVGTLLATRAA